MADYDDENFCVYDPYFGDAPKAVAIGDFVLAWLEMNYRYATISVAKPAGSS